MAWKMQNIVINSTLTGKYRTEVINNRPHLVTEMVSIEGDSVMNSLLYPLDAVTASYAQLDSIPAPAGHPTINGQNVSAFHPLAVNAHGVGGFVRNPRMQGKRVINELVFDIDAANKDERGKEIIKRIESGMAIGVSTGLNAKISKTNGELGSKKYTGVVSDIKFDHVAVLLNEKPAGDSTFTINEDLIICNMDDYKPAGNSITNQEVTDMDKEKLVLALIGNSATRFTEADKDSLMSMSESSLVNALSGAFKSEITVDAAQKVIEGAGMQIANADYNAAEYAEYISNKDAFAEFTKSKAEARKQKVDEIVANSKLTAEQVSVMADDAIESLLNSLVPKQNYSAQGQPVTNSDGGTHEIKLHEGA